MGKRIPMRTGPVFLALVIALATTGVGYGLWTSNLSIADKINTAALDGVFRKGFTDDDGRVNDPTKDSGDTGDCPTSFLTSSSCDPAASGVDPKPRADKNLARCTAAVGDGLNARISKRLVYPGYFCTAWFEVFNRGSLPFRIAKVTVDGTPLVPSVPEPFDLNGDGEDDVAVHLTGIKRYCDQIDPQDSVWIDIDQEILDDIPQSTNLGFNIEVTLVQWNTECLEVDEFPDSAATMTLTLPDGQATQVQMTGPTTVEVALGAISDTDRDGLDQVQTEIVSMSLTGASPEFGQIGVTLQPDTRSLGIIEELENRTPGVLDVAPFTDTGTADSFFDVWTEVSIDGRVLWPAGPIRVEGVISHKPPAPGEGYSFTGTVELLDENGDPTGIVITGLVHIPVPRPSNG